MIFSSVKKDIELLKPQAVDYTQDKSKSISITQIMNEFLKQIIKYNSRAKMKDN